MAVEEKFKSLQGKINFEVYNDDSGEYETVHMKAINMKEGTSNDDILGVLSAIGELSSGYVSDLKRIDTTRIEGEIV